MTLDMESLESDNLIFLYQDGEGSIWTCFQVAAPTLSQKDRCPLKTLRANVESGEPSRNFDLRGLRWHPLDRHDGRAKPNRSAHSENIVLPGSGVANEILSILEDPAGALFCGTFRKGLQRINQETGRVSQYVPSVPETATGPIMQMIYDHAGNLWAAIYGRVGRFDQKNGRFVMYTPENPNTIQYQKINEDSDGYLWLGAQTGLHRFDPRTGQFTIYEHHPDDPSSLSDNRINSVHFDHSGNLWVGAQDGLGRLDRQTRSFRNYYEKDGLAGDVVSCIQEDNKGVLWMGTNNGLSSFNSQSGRFQNFSAADGLPG